MKLQVLGKVIDDQTRCVHYHQGNDIIAIKFKCCGQYFPCHACHEETTDHEIVRWAVDEFNEHAILCGVCKVELTIAEYMLSGEQCPNCKVAFNPNCKLHYSLYFEGP